MSPVHPRYSGYKFKTTKVDGQTLFIQPYGRKQDRLYIGYWTHNWVGTFRLGPAKFSAIREQARQQIARAKEYDAKIGAEIAAEQEGQVS